MTLTGIRSRNNVRRDSKAVAGAKHAPATGRKGFPWMSVAHRTGEMPKRTGHFSRVGDSAIMQDAMTDDPSDPFGRVDPNSSIGEDQ